MVSVSLKRPTYEGDEYDELVTCPYDPVHRVTAARFVRHILKCKKQHPNAKMSTCPFNARHIIPSAELQTHKTVCPDKKYIEAQIGDDDIGAERDTLHGNTSIPLPACVENDLHFGDGENWDEETGQVPIRNKVVGGKLVTSSLRDVEAPMGPFMTAQQVTRDRLHKFEVKKSLDEALSSSKQQEQKRRPLTQPQLPSATGMGRGRRLATVNPASTAAAFAKPKSVRVEKPPTLAANFTFKSPPMTGEDPNTSLTDPPPPLLCGDSARTHNGVVIDCDGISSSCESATPSEMTEELQLEREKRKLNKAAKQIKMLEEKMREGQALDEDQKKKFQRKSDIKQKLLEINDRLKRINM